MHREISHADSTFSCENNLSLYFLTALVGILIGADLWPGLAGWLTRQGLSLPAGSGEFLGYRFALLAAILGGARVLYSSLESLLEGRIGADLALAIACIAAILFNKPLVAAEVVFIGMLGECLESFTFERTRRAIRHIAEVFPRRCWLLKNGEEVRVLTRELQVGDHVVVKPGGRIPVDGIVVAGRSALDMSALTGESFPVDKGPGDEVWAGTLNQFGALTLETRKVADETVAGQVIEWTAKALKDKAPIERTADRLARYFLPVVLALAAITFLVGVWVHLGNEATGRRSLLEAARLSIDPTLALLVVACPCSLILATPAAVIAALGRLAGTGVLIKGGSSLERLAAVHAFAFDKTGTLTLARLALGETLPQRGLSADGLLQTAATAEQRSEHPLARLILREAGERHLPLEGLVDFSAHAGGGVVAQTESGLKILAGNSRFMTEQGLVLSPEIQAALEQIDRKGQTSLLIAREGIIVGVVGVQDQLRPEAAAVVAELRTLGINNIALLTGDRRAVARNVAEELGISEIQAELLPQQKAEFLARWSGVSSRNVAMVGDGINDAPALACAGVGLAIGGTGSDLAAEAGDIVLMGDPLRTLPLLIRLSRQTVRIIWQNIIVFAFGVNLIGITVTAWLWPFVAPLEWRDQAPLAAVLYHQVGSLAVLLNSMRLLGFERREQSPTWQRARGKLHDVDQWIDHFFNADEIGHWLEHHWRPVILILGFLLATGYFLSGFTQIYSDEIGLVRHFGRSLPDTMQPGLHWCWPWPVDEVTRFQPGRIHTVEIGFRTIPTATNPPENLAWASAHGGDGVQSLPEEAVMITGDGNLIEVHAVIRYTVRDPRTYLFDIRDPDEIVRAAGESVLRETVAGLPFMDLLTTQRGRLQQEGLTRLTRRLEGDGLGIRLEGVSLPDLHPPQEVVASYHNVTNAMETRDRMVNQAQADSLEKERNSEAQALQITRQAEVEKYATIRLTEAEQEVFLERLQARSQLSGDQEYRLMEDMYSSLRRRKPMGDAYQDYNKRREEMQGRQKNLTDFRLFWEALGNALANREKVIIDADKIPGRHQLMFFDPELFRLPPINARGRNINPGKGQPEGRGEGSGGILERE